MANPAWRQRVVNRLKLTFSTTLGVLQPSVCQLVCLSVRRLVRAYIDVQRMFVIAVLTCALPLAVMTYWISGCFAVSVAVIFTTAVAVAPCVGERLFYSEQNEFDTVFNVKQLFDQCIGRLTLGDMMRGGLSNKPDIVTKEFFALQRVRAERAVMHAAPDYSPLKPEILWGYVEKAAEMRRTNPHFQMKDFQEMVLRDYPAMDLKLGTKTQKGTVAALFAMTGFVYGWRQPGVYEQRRRQPYALALANNVHPLLERLYQSSRFIVANGDLTTVVVGDRPVRRGWTLSWDEHGDYIPNTASGASVKVFNVTTSVGPLTRSDGSRVIVTLPQGMDWNSASFHGFVLPKIMPELAAFAKARDAVPLLAVDGEGVQIAYPAGSYEPNAHNKNFPSKQDASHFFGLPPGRGHVANKAVALAWGIEGADTMSADELVQTLW